MCVPASQPAASPLLSIIVPTYRDGARICMNLLRLDAALAELGETYEIIVVSDGNVDNTYEEALRVGASHVHVHHYERNMGKGFALRYGVSHSCGDIITFIDGDGDIDPAQIATYLQIMRETKADIVVGSKRHPDSEVVYPMARRIYSWTYQTLLQILFALNVRDTQVGLKLFRRRVLADVLPRIVVKRFAFDLELLVVAHHLGFTHVVEAPVRIGQRFNSTINLKAIMSILQETAAIFYRRHILHYYDRPRESMPVDVELEEGSSALT
jgi:glycosyltransferase involved in cell wall biosynthesis